MARETTIRSLAQGTLQLGQYGRTKLPQGRDVLNQSVAGSALVAGQQEKHCPLSCFFLLFWPQSPFATKLLSRDLYAEGPE